jgi:hypothetical protein
MIRSFFSRNPIGDELRRRGVSLLLHSTHLYKNLPQIFADGALFTARALKDRYGAEASRFLHDPVRYEKFSVGLDYINASLTLPNVELLYRRSKSEWTADWIHFALDLSLLSREDTLFCPVSAATEMGKYLKSGQQGLRAMYADMVEQHKRDPIPHNAPTHPQAEVLIRGSIPFKNVQRIIAPNEGIANEVKRMMEPRGQTIRVEILPQLFIWPKWLIKS